MNIKITAGNTVNIKLTVADRVPLAVLLVDTLHMLLQRGLQLVRHAAQLAHVRRARVDVHVAQVHAQRGRTLGHFLADGAGSVLQSAASHPAGTSGVRNLGEELCGLVIIGTTLSGSVHVVLLLDDFWSGRHLGHCHSRKLTTTQLRGHQIYLAINKS